MPAVRATHPTRPLLDRASGAARVARRTLRRIAADAASQPSRTAATAHRGIAAVQPRLAPSGALRENGFTVFRGLFPAGECARIATRLKREAEIQQGQRYTKVDATNSFASARELVVEGRILDAVRSALGEQPRFLQVSDLHYLHDTAGWHRDSVHRASDSTEAPDWRDTAVPFGVVKAIVYLESDNAAMGLMAGSHLSPIEMDRAYVRAVESAGEQLVIDADDDPNARIPAVDRRTPLAWKAEVGDVLVFDERTYHAGRRVDDGRVTANREAAKFTLSLVFGRDNEHSERMYSYFRYVRRELGYRDLPGDFVGELARRDLVLTNGWGDFYRDQPADLAHVHLPDPARMQSLLAEYASATGD